LRAVHRWILVCFFFLAWQRIEELEIERGDFEVEVKITVEEEC
jgi:hypothetical protein